MEHLQPMHPQIKKNVYRTNRELQHTMLTMISLNQILRDYTHETMTGACLSSIYKSHTHTFLGFLRCVERPVVS